MTDFPRSSALLTPLLFAIVS
ncbi:MAG: hypothetical protein RLZZ188_35, partial [Verrucomicrobiota bacterium]